MRGQRTGALLALAAYLLAAIVVPVAHRAHHRLHGDDHVHSAAGTRYHAHHQSGALDQGSEHAAFDADLAALGLDDVALAGTASIDCALAAYTLAACDDSLPADHARGFGDALLARLPPADPAPFDPEHGRGALEHLSASLLGVKVFVLPPPARAVARVDGVAPETAPGIAARFTCFARGPPSAVAG